MKPVKWSLLLVVLFIQFAVPANAFANPAISEFDKTMDTIVLFLIYGYVFFTETVVVKLVLFGRDGPSWLRALAVAVLANSLSAIIGLFLHVCFNTDVFEFDPNFVSVFGISLGVESLVLFLIYMRSYPKRALLAGALMNAASYIFLWLLQFPKPSVF